MSAGAEIDVAEVVRCDGAVVDELKAAYRDFVRSHAVVLSKLVAVGDATPVVRYASFEVSCALSVTRHAASVQLDLAVDLVRRLPEVHAAMLTGGVDFPKARVIRDALAAVDVGLARRIAAAVLPLAATLTTGRLQARLAKMVIDADPAAAARAHKVRVRERRVAVQPGQDSCATVLGLNLPADTAMAAADRIAAIARTVKHAGDPRSLDQIRADTFLNLLLGHPTGADAPRAGGGMELVAPLATLAGLAEHPGHLNGYGPVIADIARQVAAQQHHTPWTFTIYDDATGEIYTGTTRARPADQPARPDPSRRPAHTDPPSRADRAHQPTKAAQPTHQPAQGHWASQPNQAPPTSDPTRAARAGQRNKTARSQPTRSDRGGRADRVGQPSQARPAHEPTRPDRVGHPSQARPAHEPTRADRASEPNQARSKHDPTRADRRRGAATTGTGRNNSGAIPASGNRFDDRFGDPNRRFPNAALARHIRARDRTCRAPGCRRPATRADLDHTIAYEAGGRTVRENLGPLCRYHHMAKHEGGWKLHQISPGVFVWQSPLGKIYIVRPEPP